MDSVLQLEDYNGVLNHKEALVANHKEDMVVNHKVVLVVNHKVDMVLLEPKLEDSGELKEELNQEPKLVANGVLSNQAHHKVDNMELEHRAVPKANGEPDNLSPPNMGFLLRNLKIASN